MEINKIRRMPVVFGPAPGPRQAPDGVSYDPELCPLRTTVFAKFEADEARLKKIIPKGFELSGVPSMIFEFTYLTEIDWLAGRGYNILAVKIPVKHQHNGAAVEGLFQPVIWENMADPIISGREELGYSKIFAELPAIKAFGGRMTCDALWDGFRFLRLTLSDVQETDIKKTSPLPLFHQKYFPATQDWGEADVDYITVNRNLDSPTKVLSQYRGHAELKFNVPEWDDMPTQYHIVQQLASLGIKNLISAGVVKCQGAKDLSDQERIKG